MINQLAEVVGFVPALVNVRMEDGTVRAVFPKPGVKLHDVIRFTDNDGNYEIDEDRFDPPTETMDEA